MPTLDDVDLNDADRARIEYLSSTPSSITESEAERIVRFAKLDRCDRVPAMLRNGDAPPTDAHGRTSDAGPDGSHGAGGDEDGDTAERAADTASFCADVRRGLREADRPATVIDKYPDTHPSAIFRHAEGRCTCRTDVDPTTSPPVQADECRDMRRAFQSGATKRDIMADFHRSSNAVNTHLFGKCNHDRRRSAAPSASLTPSECGHLREAYRRNAAASIDDVAFAYGIAASTAYKHLLGKCDHGVDVDPIEPTSVDAEACDGMRRSYERDPGNTVASIAYGFGVSRPTADYHIFGRCACDGDEPASTRR